ncbi:hypothetical protein [Sinorhizobium fredii]|uniref:Uncharacterized protein n=1 Tax=Rhizobium fredii TaxID=380 RepID=A0A844AMS7_RHIFR|nr:hypothetical protein [Sinorhizobium fredii]MQX12902.1 hypothetical protein [Sinorhizobium fredii]
MIISLPIHCIRRAVAMRIDKGSPKIQTCQHLTIFLYTKMNGREKPAGLPTSVGLAVIDGAEAQGARSNPLGDQLTDLFSIGSSDPFMVNRDPDCGAPESRRSQSERPVNQLLKFQGLGRASKRNRQ